MSLLNNGEHTTVTSHVAPTHYVRLAYPTRLSIGKLARITGETVKTLRYWTDRGLLEAERGENNYRTYDHSALDRAAFIREAQGLGLRLEAVGRLLDLANKNKLPCGQVEEELGVHLAGVRAQIAVLHALEVKLVQMLASAEEQPCKKHEGCRYLPLSHRA